MEINQSLKLGDTYFDIDDLVQVKTGDKFSSGLGSIVTIDVPKCSYQGRISSIKTGIIEVDSSTELHSNVHKIRINDILEMKLISKFNKGGESHNERKREMLNLILQTVVNGLREEYNISYGRNKLDDPTYLQLKNKNNDDELLRLEISTI